MPLSLWLLHVRPVANRPPGTTSKSRTPSHSCLRSVCCLSSSQAKNRSCHISGHASLSAGFQSQEDALAVACLNLCCSVSLTLKWDKLMSACRKIGLEGCPERNLPALLLCMWSTPWGVVTHRGPSVRASTHLPVVSSSDIAPPPNMSAWSHLPQSRKDREWP